MGFFNTAKRWISKYGGRVLYVLVPGLALLYVLYVFQGFNIQTEASLSGHGYAFRCVSFGAVATLTLLSLEATLFRTSWYRRGWRAVAIVFTEMVLSGTAVFVLFNFFWADTEWYWDSYALLMREFVTVALLPMVGLRWYFSRSKPPKETTLEEQTEERLHFASENQRDRLALVPHAFVYAESADNYVEVYYLSQGQLHKQLLRTRMKELEEAFADSPYVERCHRRYLVNPTHVQNQLQLRGKQHLDVGYTQLPVSPSYAGAFPL